MTRFLSIDSGPNALPALMILREIMERYKFDHPPKPKPKKGRKEEDEDEDEETLPCDIFSMTIGSGHGGLIAILLGKLRMSVDAALEAYGSLLETLPIKPARSEAEKVQNAKKLEGELRRILYFKGITANDMMREGTRTTGGHKVVVCAGVPISMGFPYYIRSYPHDGVPTPPCTILQAAMACMADPRLYPAVTIGDSYHTATLVEAPARFANPTWLLVSEAKLVYGAKGIVRLILSLGGGDSELATIKTYMDPSSRTPYEVESGQIHQDLFPRVKHEDVYYRLQPRGHFGWSEDMATILARVSGFLQDLGIQDYLDSVVSAMDAAWTQHAMMLEEITLGIH